jgi:NADH:ubiquinone oxidoreductase subunit 2 (subunit N)
VLGAVNIFIGNLLALRQQQVKRLLAYSSVSHIGYMLFGFGIGFYAADIAGIQSGLLHLINHGLMKGAAFLAAGALMFALNTHAPLEVGDLAGMGKRYPLLCMSMAVALLGLGGIPPLAGFVSKMQIFISGVNAGSSFVTGLVVFAALNTLISIGYYLRLIGAMYAVDAPSRLDGRTIPNTILVPILLLVLAVVVLGVLPGLLNTVTAAAAQAIF